MVPYLMQDLGEWQPHAADGCDPSIISFRPSKPGGPAYVYPSSFLDGFAPPDPPSPGSAGEKGLVLRSRNFNNGATQGSVAGTLDNVNLASLNAGAPRIEHDDSSSMIVLDGSVR